ncbi:acyltransferase family protein, partial [Burkholderia cenocepacia]
MTKTLSVPATAAAGTLVYRPDIDGLRAFAVLAVVVFHAFPSVLPGGFVGVDVFFVISGYLITGILLADLGTDRFSFGRFYARRIRRIFPALVVVLLATYGMG